MPYLIGISGGSGSGKTSFLKGLKDCLDPNQACFISFDDYYRPREDQQKDSNGISNFDLPESMEVADFVRDLDLLIEGKSVKRLEYTFNNENLTPQELVIEPAEVIIVEGLFVYHYKTLKERFDLKLFVDADDELKIIRRIIRDKEERNYPLEDVLYRYKNHVIPSYRQYIEPYVKEMDLIINNNHSFDQSLKVICQFIKSFTSQNSI